jgi:MoaA/NifB/PqqE/SkfB family radical SAM enzyme
MVNEFLKYSSSFFNFWGLGFKYVETKILKEHTSSYCYNRPIDIVIETTNRCQMSCTWCARHFRPVTDDMSLDIFKQIVEDIGYVKNLYPCGVGEPLLHKDFDKCINIASDHSSYTNINTNGLLLNRDNIERLNASGLSELIISLDAINADEYFMLGKGKDFDLFLNNLRLYSEYGKIPFRLHSVVATSNLESVVKIPELVKSLGINTIDLNFVHSPPGLTHLLLNPQQIKETVNVFSDKCNEYGIKTNVEVFLKSQPTSFCSTPFFTASVDSEGYINPCCNYPQLRLGNVLKDGFWKTWNNKPMRDFRDDVKCGNFDVWCSTFCIKFRDSVNQTANTSNR